MASPQRGSKLLWKSAEQKRSSVETWRGDSTNLSTSYATERGRRVSRPSKGGQEAGKISPLRRKSQVEGDSGEAVKGKHGTSNAPQKQKQRKDQEDVLSLLNRGARAGLFPAPQSARTIPRVPLSARGGVAAGKKEEAGSLTSRTHSKFVDNILSVRKQRQSQGPSDGVADVSRSLVKDLPRLNLSSLNPLQGAASSYRGNASKAGVNGRYGTADGSKESARAAKLISAYGETKAGGARKSRIVVEEEESDSVSECASSGTSDSGNASERKEGVRASRQARPSTAKGPVKTKDDPLGLSKKAQAATGTQNRALESARGKKKDESSDVSEAKATVVRWPPPEVTSPPVAGLREGVGEGKPRTEGGLKEEKSGASLRSSRDRLKAQEGGDPGSPAGSVSERNGSDGGTPRRKTTGLGGGSESGTPKKSLVGGLREGGGETPGKTAVGSSGKEVKSAREGGANETSSPRYVHVDHYNRPLFAQWQLSKCTKRALIRFLQVCRNLKRTKAPKCSRSCQVYTL